MVVEIEIREPHTPDDPYRYHPWPESGRGSCNGIDGLGPGTRLRFRLVNRAAPARDRFGYSAIPIDELPNVSVLDQPSGSGSVLASQNRSTSSECGDTWWRFFANRHYDLDDDPFGEEPTPGQYPPLVIQREINACGCLDRWVGVIRHVDPEDAGVDDG
jgi:hypothetical protein